MKTLKVRQRTKERSLLMSCFHANFCLRIFLRIIERTFCFSAPEMALNGCVIWIDPKTDSCSNKHDKSCLRTETIFYDSLYCLQIIYQNLQKLLISNNFCITQ